MRVTGVDACRRGWVAVSLEVSGLAPPPARTARCGPFRLDPVRADASLERVLDGADAGVVAIDMPLGLLESGWREADRVARRLLGPRRSSVFAIPPRAVWAEASYQAASQRCRELLGQRGAWHPARPSPAPIDHRRPGWAGGAGSATDLVRGPGGLVSSAWCAGRQRPWRMPHPRVIARSRAARACTTRRWSSPARTA